MAFNPLLAGALIMGALGVGLGGYGTYTAHSLATKIEGIRADVAAIRALKEQEAAFMKEETESVHQQTLDAAKGLLLTPSHKDK